jgi:hypothetical protein
VPGADALLPIPQQAKKIYIGNMNENGNHRNRFEGVFMELPKARR